MIHPALIEQQKRREREQARRWEQPRLEIPTTPVVERPRTPDDKEPGGRVIVIQF